MPYKLHPSGYCTHFSYEGVKNLIIPEPCPHCKRVAGHAPTCPCFHFNDKISSSSRSKLFDRSAILFAKNDAINFYTFTLPSKESFIYQRAADCIESGDLQVSKMFSRTLEAWSLREKRKGNHHSYSWTAEAQMKRQKKYGGIGDIHFHMVSNVSLKSDNNQFISKWHREYFEWIQSNWNSQIGLKANNSLDIRPVPRHIKSLACYLSKYLGKGTDRKIHSKRFYSTHDLNAFKPITLQTLPDLPIYRKSSYTTNEGYLIESIYYETSDVLETYGHHFQNEAIFS
jgi:hypothetical protein